MNTSGKYSIVGMGEVAPAANEEYKGFWGLAAEAAQRALDDAALKREDIDGVVFYGALGPPFPKPSSYCSYFCQYFGIKPGWWESVPYGGMPPGGLGLVRAIMGIEAGLATKVLVISSDNFRSRLSKDGAIEAMSTSSLDAQYEWPYGPLNISTFGLIATRHMYEFGTTNEQMAAVAVAARQWAQLNPIAERQELITIEDVLNSRVATSPLHVLDICLISDGGGAVVITASEQANDYPQPPVKVLGFGEVSASMTISHVKDLTDIVPTRLATQHALRMADIELGDVDIVYPYDPSTITTIFTLEEMGFCKRGEGGSFVADGKLGPGGSLPTNTHGGLMACRHPGMPGAFFQITESVKQLRDQAEGRQVHDARITLLHSEGGYIGNNVTVLGRP